MKNLLFFLLLPLALTGCKKILGTSGNYTFTGTLYKDCNKTPIANAKIVCTTFGGTGFSPLTRSFSSETDANGRFFISAEDNSTSSITIELANPPKYLAGPEIGRMDTKSLSKDVTYDFGELFATSQGQAGDAKYYAKTNLIISNYYQQQDSLIIGYYKNDPIIISPVPSAFVTSIYGPPKSGSFVTSNFTVSAKLVWATSLQDYKNSITTSPKPRGVYEGTTTFTICNNGQSQDFVVDTISHN